jgi:NADH-quinone oxidoreductase subunit J
MLLFIIFGAVSIFAALGVILIHKPVYSALFLMLNFSTLAIFYVMLQAQFLAAVQVIVYSGAIVVLFLFVVMLIGGGEMGETAAAGWLSVPGRRGWPRVVAAVLAVVLLGALGYGVVAGTLSSAQGSADVFGQGSVQAMGAALYTSYLYPFELTSVLLLVGMIGAVVLAQRKRE